MYIYSQIQSKHLKNNRYILPKPTGSPGSPGQAERSANFAMLPHRKSQNANPSSPSAAVFETLEMFWDVCWQILL